MVGDKWLSGLSGVVESPSRCTNVIKITVAPTGWLTNRRDERTTASTDSNDEDDDDDDDIYTDG